MLNPVKLGCSEVFRTGRYLCTKMIFCFPESSNRIIIICYCQYFIYFVSFAFGHNVLFGWLEGGPILFLLSPEVSGTSGTMSIYIYIYMSTTWQTRNRYVIFRLYFGKIHSFAPDFISKESFRPEEFFEVLF